MLLYFTQFLLQDNLTGYLQILEKTLPFFGPVKGRTWLSVLRFGSFKNIYSSFCDNFHICYLFIFFWNKNKLQRDFMDTLEVQISFSDTKLAVNNVLWAWTVHFCLFDLLCQIYVHPVVTQQTTNCFQTNKQRLSLTRACFLSNRNKLCLWLHMC